MAYLLKGVFSKARVNLLRLFKSANEVYPPYTNAGAPTSGTSGTLKGIAEPGALLIDTTNKTIYQNTNTTASPTWTIFSLTSGSGAFTGSFDGTVGANTPSTGVFTTETVATLTQTGVGVESVANALTASTTQTRVGGLALTKKFNRLTTVTNAADAVTLPALIAGQSAFVWNDGAHAASVFPNGASDAIDGGSAGAAVTLTNAKHAMFLCVATNVIVSAQLGVASA